MGLSTGTPFDKITAMTSESPNQLDNMRLVNRFLTPFAAFLVLSGVVLAVPRGRDAWLSLAILAVTASLNMATLRWASARPDHLQMIRQLRLVANHFLNVWLIWLMLPHWGLIWLLFLLTMIAVGTYEGWRETLSHAVLMGGLLAVVSYMRGIVGMAAWGQVAVQAATLACVGLFTNRLVSRVRAEPRVS